MISFEEMKELKRKGKLVILSSNRQGTGYFKNELFAYLQNDKNFYSCYELAEKFGRSTGTVYNSLRRLEKDGKIKAVHNGKKTYFGLGYLFEEALK